MFARSAGIPDHVGMATDRKPKDSNSSDEPKKPPAWAERLRERARELGLTDIAVARRAGLPQSRYASYVIGKREPDLMTFVRICEALSTRPDMILGVEASEKVTTRDAIRMRVISALEALDAQGQHLALVALEAMAEATLPEARAKPQTPKPSRRHLA
jgi:transcriptional regulator with XRE-family HTH domain